MNQSSSTNDMQTNRFENNLDRALSDYFKSKMKQPWPAAPSIPARIATTEPSVLVDARTEAEYSAVEPSRNQTIKVGVSRDGGHKSRYTLAVSVAVLLGVSWCLSNGLQPGERIGPASSSPKVYGVFQDAGAENPATLKELRKDKAEQGNDGFAPPKIKLP